MDDIRGIYKHFKGGLYEVLGVCTSNKASQLFVMYRPLYNDSGLWIRLYSMFFSEVLVEEKPVSRFSFIEKAYGTIDQDDFPVLHSETHDKLEVIRDDKRGFVVIA
jgi:hypothetical protein